MKGALLVSAALLLAVNCSATRTPFSRATGDAGSTLSAAYETLRAARDGEVTREYAQGSLVNFSDVLSGVGEQLPGLQGAPDATTVEELATLLEPAVQAIREPCLGDPCDPRPQLEAIAAARDAFVEASET